MAWPRLRLPDHLLGWGVVHLLPLPGAPTRGPGLDAVIARACADARRMAEGGLDGVVVENLGDTPFCAGAVPPWTVAAMTAIATAVRAEIGDLPLAINVLRNDPQAAMAVATAVGGSAIRVNVLTGAAVTDQGVIQGAARELAMTRRLLDADPGGAQPVAVLADVHVKHAVPLGPSQLEDAARDTWARAGADALILSGSGTGRPTDPSDLDRVRAACPDAPLWVGSGTTPATVGTLRGRADGVIVGTWLHEGGDLTAPVDARRVATLRRALDGGSRREG